MTGGTVNIARSLWDDPAFKAEPYTEREAFIWLIMEAAWKPRTRRIAGHVVDLQRGEAASSVRFMAEAWSWSKSRVSRYLARLRVSGLIENRDSSGTANGTGLTVVTICKYDEYQYGGDESGTPLETKSGQQRDSSGTNDKKLITNLEKEEPDGSSKKRRGARLREDWVLPRAWGSWAVEQGWPEAVIRAEADKFKDYWIAIPGQKGVKLDWQATWRNWMRRNHPITTGGTHERSRTHGRSAAAPASEASSIAGLLAERRIAGQANGFDEDDRQRRGDGLDAGRRDSGFGESDQWGGSSGSPAIDAGSAEVIPIAAAASAR
ncbi:MAG: hypothetical protein AAF405_00240 [Pseudomonadota bacterium]